MRPGQTRVYALPSTTFKSSELQLRLAAQLDLRPGPPRPAKPARAVVLVSTSDDECFPCPKALLKPCIALTKAVRDPADEVHASVPVDCSTSDLTLTLAPTLTLTLTLILTRCARACPSTARLSTAYSSTSRQVPGGRRPASHSTPTHSRPWRRLPPP